MLEAEAEELLLDMVEAARSALRHEQRWLLHGGVLKGPPSWGAKEVLDHDVHALDSAGCLHGQYNYVYGNRYVITAKGYASADRLRERRGAAVDPTGWSAVDLAVDKLRDRLRHAEDAYDFKAVGLLCADLLAALGRAVFDPERHLPPHAQSPARDDAKKRIGYFLDMVASGERFYHVRRLVRATWDQAQAVKHRAEPNRTDAGVATDAAVLLASILRRLVTEVDECDQSTKRSGV